MQRFDPLHPAVLCDPYPTYAQLRVHDPVHWGSAADAGACGCWYVTRFADVAAMLKDPRFGREVDKVLPAHILPPVDPADQPLRQMADWWMILRDPPMHTRLRSVVQRAYTPRRVEALRPAITATAHRLIDAMLAQGPPLDLLQHFALPFSVQIVAHVLGLPVEDYPHLMPWSRALASVIDLNQSEENRQRSRRTVAELTAYLDAIIASRRHTPQDDLISALLQLEGDHALSGQELRGDITILLFAGNDPVMHQIGNGVMTLLQHPDQLALLRGQPALWENAVDELLRYDSSVQMTFRYALSNIEWAQKTLRTGDHVALVFGSANRDPALWPEPDRLDLQRSVGQTATFGFGIHYCLGAALARQEGQVALSTLWERLPTLALATDQLEWQPTVAVRGVTRLPITW
jgi:hypothetical protein